jgi:iron only hydrogenase large subunit-like protein
MAQFSGALKLADLNDFIAPSQACVVTLNGNKIDSNDQSEVSAVKLLRSPQPPQFEQSDHFLSLLRSQVGMVQLQRPAGFPQTQPTAPEGPVKVSLHDCLACSGCVTSAETVLLQHQSTEEFAAKLADPSFTVMVSLSPQSMVSLAAALGLAPADCVAKVTAVLRAQGAAAVFDISWARDVALLETAAEFVERYRRHRGGGGAEASGVAPREDPSGAAAAPLPMLASACPGWVCYAEKTHGTYALPYIATAKSPQAVMGTVVKQQWAPAAGLDPGRVYHCAVMPCYDKKLEAARDDFTVAGADGAAVAETDSVLATTELYEWLQELKIDWSTVPPAPLDAPFTNQVPGGRGEAFGAPGGSGGYMEYVFKTAARELFGQEVPPGPLPTTQGRNADIRECVLAAEGRPALRFAAAYGFRNIQGLMRKIKAGRCEYDYVEVMACPSGCLNGGGQVRPPPGQTAAQLIEQLEMEYHSEAYLHQRAPQDNPSVAALYREWVGDAVGGPRARETLHTAYHRREKTLTSAIADW